MTREEAYYILRVSRDEIQSKGHTEFDMLDLPCLDMAISALRDQESAKNAHCNSCKKRNSWISVEERLPDKNGQYLVYTKWTYGSFIRLCCWTPKYNGFEEHLKGRAIWYVYDSEYGDYECKDITHWMPLPEPPKEEV